MRARAWYAAVHARTPGASDYALEKRFAAAPVTDDAPWVSTGNWRAYRDGRVPEIRYAERVEQAFPGTRIWLELPFWESIRVPCPTLARLHALMASLRPDISALLFFDPDAKGDQLERLASTDRTFKELDRLSDIEALTACMAILREAEIHNDEYRHIRAAITGLRIFVRLAAFSPFTSTAPVILEHLAAHFLCANYVHVPRRGPASGGVDLELENYVRNTVVVVLSEFGVLPRSPSAHRACLYLADIYGLGNAARELYALSCLKARKAAKSANIVRWFSRRLRAIESTTSCID